MTPPPLKFGQRELFNDSFLSFLRRGSNKQQQIGPAPHAQPQSPQSMDSGEPLPMLPPMSNEHGHIHGNGHAQQMSGGGQDSGALAEKKALWADGMQLIDRTKDMLEMGARVLGKDTTKKLRKEAARWVALYFILFFGDLHLPLALSGSFYYIHCL